MIILDGCAAGGALGDEGGEQGASVNVASFAWVVEYMVEVSETMRTIVECSFDEFSNIR